MKNFLVVALLLCLPTLPAIAGSTEWQAHKNGVWRIQFSPEGTFFLTTGGDGYVRMWWSECLCSLTHFKHDTESRVWDAAFLSDGRVASTSWDGSTYIWNRESGEKIKKLDVHSEYNVRVRSSLDGTRLFTAGTDDYVRIFDAKTFELLGSVKTRSPVGIIPFGEGNQKLLTLSLEGLLTWDLSHLTVDKKVSQSPYYFTAEPIDAHAVVVGGNPEQGGPLEIRNLNTLEIEKTLEPRSGFFWQIAVSPNHEWIAASAFQGKAYVWERATGKVIFETPESVGKTISLAFFPEGRAILVGTDEGFAKVVRF